MSVLQLEGKIRYIINIVMDFYHKYLCECSILQPNEICIVEKKNSK